VLSFFRKLDKVQYLFVRHVIHGVYQDIHNGERYKSQSGPGKFFSVPEHTCLNLCTDGVPLFKSSSKCMPFVVEMWHIIG